MNGSQLEGSRQAVKWSICLDRIWTCLASELLLFFISHCTGCWKVKKTTTMTKYFIYINKRIALPKLLTERHKLRSQFLYPLCKFVALLGSSSQRLFSIFVTVSSNKCNCNLESFENHDSQGFNLIKVLFLSIHPPYITELVLS